MLLPNHLPNCDTLAGKWPQAQALSIYCVLADEATLGVLCRIKLNKELTKWYVKKPSFCTWPFADSSLLHTFGTFIDSLRLRPKVLDSPLVQVIYRKLE